MRLRLTIIIILFCCPPVFAQSNPDSLLALIKNAKEDTAKVDLLVEMSAVYFQKDNNKSREYGQQVLDLATKLHYDIGIVRGNNLVGRTYAVQDKLPEALKYFEAALQKAHEIKNARYEGMMHSSISAVYTANDDYDKALQHALQAKEVFEKGGVKNTVNLFINIGYLYVRQAKYDDALKYYQEGLQHALEPGSQATPNDIADLFLNRGSVYIRVGDFVPALQDFFKADSMLVLLGNTQNHTMSMANIGETYRRVAAGMSKKPLPDSLRDANLSLSKAEHYLAGARKLAEQLQSIYIRSEVYSSLSDMYGQMQRYDSAYRLHKLYMQMSDSLHNLDKEKEFARMDAQLLVKKQTDSLNYLNALKDHEIDQQKMQRNAAILLISLAGIIGLLLINRQKLKHIQKRKIAEAEKQRAEELARQQLSDFTRSIQEKNVLIEQFSAELERYQSLPCSNDLPEKEHSLQLLQNAVILNDEQWADFQSLFNKVHTGYINRVKEKYPDLTTAELRSILLTKLGLSNKEMAAMLGVSLEAVRVNKHRLLKKIHLPEDTSLEDVVHTI